ncbi:MAG: UDP-N-acetylglucosamine 2-epimerase (non-hydrolyzing) [Anaerolineae bacterium]|nr:UDP-N-acetylglucosamine 2-epimerase (non-hydrolyzing) [Anaerolineae bacterium]
MLIFSIVGARPQFIKASPFSSALRTRHREFLVHTGQHYDEDMSEVFFQQLGIPQPDANLNIGSGSHAEQTGAMLMGLEKLMIEQHPDWVVVYGDTNSTLAGALAAAKLHIPIAHVEAGLRSYNRAMPEEINRVLTDHISTLCFCPTTLAVDNLAGEGIREGVLMVGDIMVDSVLRHKETARQQSDVHARLGLKAGQPYAVATVHRPANTDSPEALAAILAALGDLEIPVIFPLHPRTRGAIANYGLDTAASVQLVNPLGYLDMLALVEGAAVLLTDSGGLQKEAYLLQTPCVTIRTETEWAETVESGWNRLAATERTAIREAARSALSARPTNHPSLYGDGHAAERMVAALEKTS